MLSKTIARSTVQEISKLVNKNINMMDVDGIIIASSNPIRVGQKHWGAKKIISDNLDELYVSIDDIENIHTDQYVQSGLNLPLILNGETAGVIGITGAYDEVSQIGNIIKKMAEIMLEEQIKNQQLAADKWEFASFINDYINNRSFNFSDNLTQKANNLKFNLKNHYYIAIFSYENHKNRISKISYKQELNNYLQNQVQYLINKSLIVEKENHCLIFIPDSKESANKTQNKLINLIATLQEGLAKNFDLKTSFGISSLKNNSISPYENFEQAEFALFYAKMTSRKISFYDDLDFANTIFYLPDHLKQNFLEKFYKDLTDKDIEEYYELFKAYFEYEGSITEIAESMFIHSNTVQYRLNKFVKITGKDIRKPSQSHLFNMAILFETEKRDREQLLNNQQLSL